MISPSEALRGILNLALPPTCICCGRPAAEEQARLALCQGCAQELATLTAQSACRRCGRTIGPYGSCPECAADPPAFETAIRIGTYAGPLAQLIRTVKFREGRYAVPLLADLLLAKLLHSGALAQVDLVTAVPLHWFRCYRRGCNQVSLLVRALGRRGLAVPVARLLVRTRNTRPQVGLSKAARRENVRGAFRVRRPEQVAGRRVLLVDDVMTTGATLAACAQALRNAGAEGVSAAVAAVAEGDRQVVA